MIPKQETDFTPDCDTLLDLIPEYAFGMMDADETRRVEANLRLCPEAVTRLDEYRHIQEEMRASVPQTEPSTQLGLKLMAALNAPVVSAPSVVKPAAPQVQARRRTFRAAWVVALAAVIALILTNVYWLTRVGTLTQSPNLMTTLLSTGQNNTFIVANTDALHWVRLASNTETTPTQPSPTAQPNQPVQAAAAAFMMWNSQSKIGLLYARNFPALKPGEIYHLWLTNGDKLAFGGVFQVDSEGDGALIFTSSEPIDDFTWARITAQSPENSTGVPTGEPVVIGQLS